MFCFSTLPLIFCSSDQSTALHEAAYNGHLAVCELLIASKADVKAISRCALKNIYILNLLLILCCILFFSFASNFADFVLYYSHAFHSPACLQLGQHPPQIGHRREQTRRCGVAAQRWRFTVRAVSGHGPAMHSTRLHANAAAAAAAAAAADGDGQVNVMAAMKLPTTARAHTLLSNSSGCSRS